MATDIRTLIRGLGGTYASWEYGTAIPGSTVESALSGLASTTIVSVTGSVEIVGPCHLPNETRIESGEWIGDPDYRTTCAKRFRLAAYTTIKNVNANIDGTTQYSSMDGIRVENCITTAWRDDGTWSQFIRRAYGARNQTWKNNTITSYAHETFGIDGVTGGSAAKFAVQSVNGNTFRIATATEPVASYAVPFTGESAGLGFRVTGRSRIDASTLEFTVTSPVGEPFDVATGDIVGLVAYCHYNNLYEGNTIHLACPDNGAYGYVAFSFWGNSFHNTVRDNTITASEPPSAYQDWYDINDDWVANYLWCPGITAINDLSICISMGSYFTGDAYWPSGGNIIEDNTITLPAQVASEENVAIQTGWWYNPTWYPSGGHPYGIDTIAHGGYSELGRVYNRGTVVRNNTSNSTIYTLGSYELKAYGNTPTVTTTSRDWGLYMTARSEGLGADNPRIAGTTNDIPDQHGGWETDPVFDWSDFLFFDLGESVLVGIDLGALADSGAGTDAAALGAWRSLPATDTGRASDAAALGTRIGFAATDTGRSVDAATLGSWRQITVTNTGAGSDGATLAVIAALAFDLGESIVQPGVDLGALADGGAGTDTVTLGVLVDLAALVDVGRGSDGCTVDTVTTAFAYNDTGLGTDAFVLDSVEIALPLSDVTSTGLAADTVTLGTIAPLVYLDSGRGSDAVLGWRTRRRKRGGTATTIRERAMAAVATRSQSGAAVSVRKRST